MVSHSFHPCQETELPRDLAWRPDFFHHVCGHMTTASFFYLFCPAGHAYLNFVKAMEAEHCHGTTATETFETINYRIKTYPAREWAIVVDRAELTEGERGYGRKIPDIKELLRLELSEDAGLTEPEIIAVMLYSGPMVCAVTRTTHT